MRVLFYEINCILIVQGLYLFRLLGKYFYTTAEKSSVVALRIDLRYRI